MNEHLSPVELAQILIRLEASNPSDAKDLRNHLDLLANSSYDHLIRVIVDPVWDTATKIAAEALEAERRRNELEVQKLAAYKERTKLLQDSILPKAIPVILIMSVGIAWILVIALANFFGVDWRDIPMSGA